MLVKDTIDPLLGAAPDPELVEHIEKKALSYPGVLGVHDLMIHDYGPGSRLVSFHLEMDAKDDVPCTATMSLTVSSVTCSSRMG